MTKHRTKLWLGLGSFLLAGTSTAALAFGPGVNAGNVTVLDNARNASPVEIAAGNEGGEKGRPGGEGGEGGEKGRARSGGEGGEGGEGGTDPGAANVRFLTLLAQMEAHMEVAKRLLDDGHADMAKPHFHHPAKEIYESIESDLQARGIPSFEHSLKELGEAGDSGDAKKIAREYEEAKEAIAKARASVHADVLGSPKVQLQVAVALLKSAAHDYDEAVKDGAIADAEEYQDGWGFLLVAKRVIDGASDAVRKTAPDVDDRIKAHLKTLARAWPALVPPKRAVLGTAEVHATVSRIELAASRITD